MWVGFGAGELLLAKSLCNVSPGRHSRERGLRLHRRSRTSRDFGPIPPGRHSRECGLRFTSAEPNIQRLQRHPSGPSFPRTRESSDFKRSRTKGTGFPRSRE
ncbi:hypothetical protein [Lysobacter gummosus]|uniref:hypothetical protein n=1 Tax=Lysobacter gummosus TaxID=262324 RepID=UPI00362BA636